MLTDHNHADLQSSRQRARDGDFMRMLTEGMMHWHDGLFLLPQHMQWMQRDLIQRLRYNRTLSRPYSYGVVDMALAVEQLGIFKVRFDRLHVIMPSGVEVIAGVNATIRPRVFKQRFDTRSGGMTVSLAVPEFDEQGANIVSAPDDPGTVVDEKDAPQDGDQQIDAGRVNRIYAVVPVKLPDENTGAGGQRVLLRKVNARLVFEGEDTTDLETLPLVRLEAKGVDNVIKPREDPTFLPPCFRIGGSAALGVLLRDLATAVTTYRNDQAERVKNQREDWSVNNLTPGQLARLMRLRTLGRFGCSLQRLVAEKDIAPFDVYLRLSELAGELAALTPDRYAFDAMEYKHDDSGPVFRDLDRRIRRLLPESVEGTFKEFEFEVEGNYLVSRTLRVSQENPNRLFNRGIDFLLGIDGLMDSNDLNMLVSDPMRFKLQPYRFTQNGLMMPGIKLERDFGAPPELPQPRLRSYFRLITSLDPEMWDMVKEDERLCLSWAEPITFRSQKVSLFVTMRNETATGSAE